MISTFVRKKNGEDVELESEEPMTISEICELLGEGNESHGVAEMQKTMVSLVETLKNQPAPHVTVSPPSVTVQTPAPAGDLLSPSLNPPPKDWRRATVKITKWDNIGRISEMEIQKS